MAVTPPTSENGYVWLARTLLPAERVHVLERRLSLGVRYRMTTRDVAEPEGPLDTEVEVWVHPADSWRAGDTLWAILSES